MLQTHLPLLVPLTAQLCPTLVMLCLLYLLPGTSSPNFPFWLFRAQLKATSSEKPSGIILLKVEPPFRNHLVLPQSLLYPPYLSTSQCTFLSQRIMSLFSDCPLPPPWEQGHVSPRRARACLAIVASGTQSSARLTVNTPRLFAELIDCC